MATPPALLVSADARSLMSTPVFGDGRERAGHFSLLAHTCVPMNSAQSQSGETRATSRRPHVAAGGRTSGAASIVAHRFNA